MAQAYIKYKNRGFWIQESFIEVLSDYVCLTFEGNGVNTLSNGVKKIYSEFSDNRSGEKIGVVDIPFERYIDSSIDINYIKGVFEQTKTSLLSIDNELNTQTLNSFEARKEIASFRRSWKIPIKTQSIVETLNLLIELLNQTYPYDNHNIQYVGFPSVSADDVI